MHYDVVILGQGLAGTAIGWWLHQHQRRFLIVDRESRITSSRIAAGLVTPITGQRGVPCWAWEDAIRLANQLYAYAEAQTNQHFWFSQPAVRFFISEHEAANFQAKIQQESFGPGLALFCDSTVKTTDALRYQNGFGQMMMPTARKLDVLNYLVTSRHFFVHRNAYLCGSLDVNRDIQYAPTGIDIPSLDVRCDFLVLAIGFDCLAHQTLFPELRWNPSQGDILTLDIDGLHELRTLHRQIWLTPSFTNNPSNRSLYLLGSTFDRKNLDGIPTTEKKDWLLQRLKLLLNHPVEVVDHRTAVRPNSYDQKPVLGCSTIQPRVWLLNGLGSKGSLYAPWMAQLLVQAIFHHQSIPASLHWNRRSLPT